MEKIVLIGAGTHAKSCVEVIESTNSFEIIGFLDNQKSNDKILGYPIIGNDKEIPELIKLGYSFHISIGQLDFPAAKVRHAIYHQLKSMNASIPSIISPKAYVSNHASIEAACIIMPHVVINAGARIGANNIINTAAIVEHGCEIGENCHISTNATVNGEVKIGMHCIIGSSSVILQTLKLGDGIRVGAMSLITRSIDDAGTYVGSPAKRLAQ